MRHIDRPVQVTLIYDDRWQMLRPATFRSASGRWRIVEALDTWEEVGRWWEQEEPRTVWRVRCHAQGVYELAQGERSKAWRLLVAWD